MSQPGFHVVESDDGTREYVVRGYNTLEDAMAAMDQFKKDGMDDIDLDLMDQLGLLEGIILDYKSFKNKLIKYG